MSEIEFFKGSLECEEFLKLSARLCLNYSKLGVHVTPYRCSSLKYFSKLGEAKQRQIISALGSEIDLARHTFENPKGNDDKALWRALNFLGFSYGTDLFNRLRPQHKIEIYTKDGIQIWRNINVMEICSYTLEEIASFEWNQRYRRESSIDAEIFKIIEQLPSLNQNEYFENSVGTHIVTEIFSEERLRLKVEHECFFPLFDQHSRFSAFLVISNVESIGQSPELATSTAIRHLTLL